MQVANTILQDLHNISTSKGVNSLRKNDKRYSFHFWWGLLVLLFGLIPVCLSMGFCFRTRPSCRLLQKFDISRVWNLKISLLPISVSLVLSRFNVLADHLTQWVSNDTRTKFKALKKHLSQQSSQICLTKMVAKQLTNQPRGIWYNMQSRKPWAGLLFCMF